MIAIVTHTLGVMQIMKKRTSNSNIIYQATYLYNNIVTNRGVVYNDNRKNVTHKVIVTKFTRP